MDTLHHGGPTVRWHSHRPPRSRTVAVYRDGARHRINVPGPATLARWRTLGYSVAQDGCRVAWHGTCSHGSVAWSAVLTGAR